MKEITNYIIFYEKVRDYRRFCGKPIIVTKNLFFNNEINVFVSNDFQPVKNTGDINYSEGKFIDITDLFQERYSFTEDSFNTKISERPAHSIKFSRDVDFRWF